MDRATLQEIEKVIRTTKSLIRNSSAHNHDFEENLAGLGSIVALSGQSPETREQLKHVLEEALEIVSDAFVVEIDKDVEELYLRLVRGVVLLVRNLVAVEGAFLDIHLFLLNIQHFTHKVSQEHPFFTRTLVAYLQVVANVTQTVSKQPQTSIMAEVHLALGSENMMTSIEKDSEAFMALSVFLNNIFEASDNIYELLSNPAYENFLELYILKFDLIDLTTDSQLGHDEELVILILQKVVSHESYNKYLHSKEKSAYFDRLMKISQLIITGKGDWDNYQLAAILSWVYDYFKEYADAVEPMLVSTDADPIALQAHHRNIVIVLDIMADLSKFEATKQFLEHYNSMERLIQLLRVVHENVARKTLKKSPKVMEVGDSQNEKDFPEVKSLLIETIAFLVHGSFEAQEKVRELHGLELVLSNCMIDDSNPFIKERAIMCVKFLLEKNKENQRFVAELEAKKPVDDLALKDVGYEVEIQDGKVQLRKAPEQAKKQ